MTVPLQTPITSYTADGKTTVFPYKFYTTQYTDLVVEIDGVKITAGVTTSGVGNVNGGDVTFATAPTNGQIVDIYRSTPVARTTAYTDNGDLLARDINEDFDRIWLVQQEQKASTAANMSRPTAGGSWDAQNYPIEHVANATLAHQAVPLGQMQSMGNSVAASAIAAAASETAANASAGRALSSQTAAKASETAAAASQKAAEAAAINAGATAAAAADVVLQNTVQPALDTISRATTDAAASAASALANKNAAGASAGEADKSAAAALQSENNASIYATRAATSATAAEASAVRAEAAAHSIDANAINVKFDTKVDKTTYATDKATFATVTQLADKVDKSYVDSAIGNVDLKNVVDTASAQTIGGAKTFSNTVNINGELNGPNGKSVNLSSASAVTVPTPSTDSSAANKGYVDQAILDLPTLDMVDSKADKTYVDGRIDNIDLSKLVDLSSTQTINGSKTFSGALTLSGGVTGPDAHVVDFSKATSLSVPTPSAPGSAATKKFVEDAIKDVTTALDPANLVNLSGNHIISGDNTFTGPVSITGALAGLTIADGDVDLSTAKTVLVPAPSGSEPLCAANRGFVEYQIAQLKPGVNIVDMAVANSVDDVTDTGTYIGIHSHFSDGPAFGAGALPGTITVLEVVKTDSVGSQIITNMRTGERFCRGHFVGYPWDAWVKI